MSDPIRASKFDIELFAKSLLDPHTVPGAFAYAVLFLALATAAARLTRAWTLRLAAKHVALFADATAIRFVGQLLQVACFLVAAILYAHLVPALQKFGTALLASASVVSLVIGLAAQSTLGLLISGLALLIYRPFGIGDILVITAPTGKETATVRDFTLGYTKLQTEDDRWIIVPNSVMITNTLLRVPAAPPVLETSGANAAARTPGPAAGNAPAAATGASAMTSESGAAKHFIIAPEGA